MTYSTRADLMAHPAFAGLDTDTNGNPCVWRNFYRCHCDIQEQDRRVIPAIGWHDEWSCQCDDECPKCGASHSPEESIWIGPSDPVARALWEALPEAGVPHERTNADRAAEAEVLCVMMEAMTGVDDPRSQIQDAITHLRHLASREGFCWDCILEGVDINFDGEVEEEGGSYSPEPVCATEHENARKDSQ